MKQVKMVITDMDGTLLNSNHEVSRRFFEVFKELKKQNILFVAASGRPYYSITTKLAAIKEDIIIVAENGGLVLEQDTLLLSNAIENEKLSKLFTIVNNLENTFPMFCTKHQAYIKRASADMIQVFSEYYSNYTIIDSIEEIKDPVIKIALYHATNSEANIYPFVKHLSPEYNVVVSGNHWVDISEAQSNKGHALRFLQQKHNISPAETMAFGDYNNDFEMLQGASYSYAMENAHENIKAIANYQTTNNDDFGVERILEQLVSKDS